MGVTFAGRVGKSAGSGGHWRSTFSNDAGHGVRATTGSFSFGETDVGEGGTEEAGVDPDVDTPVRPLSEPLSVGTGVAGVKEDMALYGYATVRSVLSVVLLARGIRAQGPGSWLN